MCLCVRARKRDSFGVCACHEPDMVQTVRDTSVPTNRDTSVSTYRDTSVSIQVYAQLQRAGHEPDMVTYNVLMDAHIKAAAVAASLQ